ncbi:MAG: thiamine phosphate synthase [Propionibacterium sp.]
MSRPELDLSVYLVTDTRMCGGTDAVVATTRQAARSGVTLVQLRDHQLPDDDFVTLGRQLVHALAGTGVPLLVDDRVHLVAPIGAQGAHVGQSDLGIAEARRILGPDAILGLTVQTREQLAAARALGPGLIDYLGVGALHPTGTKPETGEIGLARIASLIEVSPWPICAIGGVKAADAPDLAGIGCAGMSVVSAICGQPDAAAATRILKDAWTDATAPLAGTLR